MNNANQSEIKQIQISPNFIKVKPKRQTRKKTSAGDLSSGTVNNIKNNLIQRIQSHKLNEMGAIEKIRSDAAIKTDGCPSSCENIYYPPVSNHLSDAMSYLSNINPVVPQIPLNKTLKNTPQPQPPAALRPSIHPPRCSAAEPAPQELRPSCRACSRLGGAAAAAAPPRLSPRVRELLH